MTDANARPAATQNSEPGLLVEDGRAYATIVISKAADAAEQYAARDLQSVLKDMTGVSIPIADDGTSISGNRILIGNTRFTDAVVAPEERAALGKESYIARLRGSDMALVGGGPYGHIYAVAEIYDRLGARWYMPGELGACIPKLRRVHFDCLDVRRDPSFEMRWIGDDITWNLRNRMNRIEDKRLPPAFVVHPRVFHSQDDLIPHERYDETHPEFFSLVAGERCRDKEAKLCNSNPELAAEIARNMGVMLQEKPGVTLMSLSPSDWQYWCDCPACRALDEPDVPTDARYSRRQMVLYNRVAEALEKEFPDQRILVGAYNVYTWPPKDPKVRVHRNLAVIICHYEDYCLAHPTNDPACPPNERYLELIRQWQAQTPHVYLYEYYAKHNWLDLPWPIVHTIAADIPFYHALGIRGLHTQYTQACIWTNFLPNYVAARLLWDHTTDVPALLDEFYVKFYGNAAEPMKRYHETLERQVAECGAHFPGNAPRNALHVFTEPILAEMEACLKDATQRAENDLVQRRLERVVLMTAFTKRLTRFFRMRQRARKCDGSERRDILGKALELIEELRAEVRSHPERYLGVTDGRYMIENFLLAREINKIRAELAGETAAPAAFRAIGKAREPWLFRADPEDVGQRESWFDIEANESKWQVIELGDAMTQGSPENVIVWYRTRITCPADDGNKDFKIRLEKLTGDVYAYWNGMPVAQCLEKDGVWILVIPNEKIVFHKPNVLTLRIAGVSAGLRDPVFLGY